MKACNNAEKLERNEKVDKALKALTKANIANTSPKSEGFQQILKNIVKTALPCADVKKVATHVKYYNEK